MPDGAFKPGDKLSAKWANRVDAAAAAYHAQAALGNSKGSKPAHSVDRSVAKIKNLTGSDLVRGHYVQLGEFELDSKDPRNLWFEGNLYDAESSQRVAIVTNAVKDGSRIDAVLIGLAIAVVDVTDTEHRFAEPADGEFVLVSAESGSIEILDTVTETGEQECAVLLAASGGGGSSTPVNIKIVLIDADIPGIDEAAPQDLLETADIPLGSGEETWDVFFQDPPDDDYAENLVDNLNLWRYKRLKLTLKYFEDGDAETGTAEAGASTTITLEDGLASTTDDYYIGDMITIASGTGSGQSKEITDYVGSTRVATVESAWSTNPSTDSVYQITSTADRTLAYTVIDDADNDRKIVRYATTDVRYDDGKPFLVGEYQRSDYPDFPENDVFPPEGLPEGFLNRRFRGIVIGGVLVTILCKPLPAPELPA